ncbi:hypothetical protein [Kitasatospora sp. NPDC050543]|uniref:hypothetical protein n=1 Tax=Kitasatospora sp. NPDC050543 TaxID=3364054 RepID=UPI0037B1C1C5
MDNLIFTIARSSLNRYVLWAGIVPCMLLAASRTTHQGILPVLVGGLTVITALSLFMAVGNATELSRTGIRRRRFFIWSAPLPWSEIAVIREEAKSKNATVLRVVMRDGSTHVLAQPINLTSAPDPDYAGRRDQLLAYWERHRTEQPLQNA